MNGFSMKDLFPLIEEGINKKGQYRFFPNGTSMLPLIREKIDSVILKKADDIKINDIVLYVRENGQYVLHRVVGIEDGCFCMCGDNQVYIEKGISKEQIKAKVDGIYRGEKFVPSDDSQYLKYVKKRVASIPIRKLYLHIKSYIEKIKG